MIATLTDLRGVVVDCKGDYQQVVDAINDIAPKGLKNNNRFIGNCLYCVASKYCVDESIDRASRELFQEFVFDNYRVNGILGEIVDVSLFDD